MQWLANLCVRRPIFATVLMLVILVVGIVGYMKLGVDRFPKIDFPVVVVTTRLPGAAPEDVETEITDKVEEAVNTISGIDELRSRSSEGVSQVFVTFVLEKDVDVAAQEVRDHVNTVIPDLPRGIDLPVVSKVDPDAAPILYIAVNADKPVREITEVADKKIRRQIESMPGVGQVVIVGGRKRQINVRVDPIKLRGFGLTASDVQRAIEGQNLTVPGGNVETGPKQLTLRVKGRVESPKEIGDLVIRSVDGHPVTVNDVGEVDDSQEETDLTAARRDGKAAVVLSIRKQSGENTIAVVDAVKNRLALVQKTLPEGYRLDVVRDNSEVIRTSVDAVKGHLIEGAFFAAIVVLLFLGNLRSTVIAAVAIPVSIIGTFAIMWIQGFTLNVMTLLALALAVGIVIDDAIVVLENIFRHVEEKGEKPFPAAVKATKEIGLAVLATTLSLCAVFVPVAFMTGIVGRFLKSFGLTMAFAIVVSLVVSFSFTPMLAARWLKVQKSHKKPILERVVDVFYRPIERVYMAMLRFVMRHRWVGVIACVLTLGSCVPLSKAAPKGFLPPQDEAHFEINMRAPEGTSLESTMILAERIAREVRTTMPGVKATLTTIGDNDQRTPNLAKIYVKLVDPDERHESQADIMARTRKDIVGHQPKDLRIDVSDVAAFSAGGSTAAVQWVLSGPDLDKLAEYTKKATEAMKSVPGAVDVDSDLVLGKPEVGVYIDRAKAADLGVQVADIANALNLLVGGLKVSNYEEHGDQYDVYERALAEYRADQAGLALMTVPSVRLGSVPLLDVVKLREGTGPSQIIRLNRRRAVTLLANVAPGAAEGAVSEGVGKAVALKMAPGYTIAPTGRSREMARAGAAFGIAFGLSFVFMYLILAAQFESWVHPITIMMTLPLTIPFALISIIVFKQQLDIFSMLGLLVLFGVVKKNSILQVDHANQLRREHGMPRMEAILQANKDRLRPILMTTVAFVAGMIPLALSKGVGSSFNHATAGIVIGGQTLSLLLTLLATPVIYSLLDDLGAFVKRLVGSRRSPEETGEAELSGAAPVPNAAE